MVVPYAEVVGDPISHSKSPLIHEFWLGKLRISGDYKQTLVAKGELASHFERRIRDTEWRGCSVTAPLKEAAARLVPDPGLSRIGAANTIVPAADGALKSTNTDVDGVAAALTSKIEAVRRVCIIGSGGAARAALEHLRGRPGVRVNLVARSHDRANALQTRFGMEGEAFGFADGRAAFAGADLLINATPLGMTGMPEMPLPILDALDVASEDALVFDMVYSPIESELLRRAREHGRRTEDGLTMLIGQAAPAFELFFGAPAPREHDRELRELLTS